MELFDIVDEKGCPTGERMERREAHRVGARHRTSHIWIVRKRDGRNEVLLQKRAMGKDSFPGCYDTSSAGHITAGDEPLVSAQRELQEELGIEAAADELTFLGTYCVSYQTEFYGKPFRDNEVIFIFIYGGEVNEADLKLQAEEVERVDWFDLEEVYEACLKRDPKYCLTLSGVELIRAHLGK